MSGDPSTGSGTGVEPGAGVEPGTGVEVFPPTLREVMLRPWWIGMLVFALVVAGVFAWLGQWQLGRAIDTDPPPPGATETVRPIADVVAPGEYLSEPLVGQRVDVSGHWVPEDFLVVSSRYNGGEQGFWVTGQFRVDDASSGETGPTSIAVAIGWAADRADADAAATALTDALASSAEADATIRGRLVSDEGPRLPAAGAPITEMTTMSPAALLGWWHDTEELSVYRPYLVADVEGLGLPAVDPQLAAIDSPAPTELSNVNWLNIFYAVEWAVFAGFAFYMWYRLARDAWEKEVEALEEAAGAAPPGD